LTSSATTPPATGRVYVGTPRPLATERLAEAEHAVLELADKAGVSQSTIANIERDNAEPQFRTIRKLANALDIEPTELLGD
jgi:transcriptional regulator with XRE-family HTH domain